jgi:uncharacterized protein DUF5990
MAEASPATRTLHLRLISEAAPPKQHDNRPTEFGLEDKKLQLHPGLERPDGSVQFDLEVQVQSIGPTRTLRFYGPHVQAKPGEQKLHLHWKYTDEPMNIRGQGIPLYTITWKTVDQVTRRTPGVLQAEVLPITERTGTIPVEWTVLTLAGSSGSAQEEE